MERRWAEAFEGAEVLRRLVAFVTGQAVLGIDGVELAHRGIPMDLGNDRCGSDGEAAFIALDQRQLRPFDIERNGIDENEIGLNFKLP